MNRTLRLWVIYALCMGLVAGAMAWMTRVSLRAERLQAEAQAQTAADTLIRSALGQLDATMTLFIQSEQARPPSHYEAFHAVSGRLEPSPALLAEDALVRLRFQVDGRDRWTSPQVPPSPLLPIAWRLRPDMKPYLVKSEGLLKELSSTTSFADLRRELTRQGGILVAQEDLRHLRKRVPPTPGLTSPFDVNIAPLRPFWMGQRLLMIRQVWLGQREYYQGCWMDWEVLRPTLLSTIHHLLPKATLEPTADPRPAKGEYLLSNLPLRLAHGLSLAPPPPSSAVRMALAIAWGTTLLAAIGAGLVLNMAIRFGQRRDTFVSAVTHELRTPLTTFRLYTEMLAMGMVSDEAEQRSFLQILLAESERLDHLVRNVLSFARLETRKGQQQEDIPLGILLDRLTPRLAQRAKQADRPLQVHLPPEAEAARLRTDPALVEQILFNLVDNACKYALPAEDLTIHLEVRAVEPAVCLGVRDHGPGIPPSYWAELFRPFHKSAQAAAHSAPGVGLGLALCRRLARSLGGDLARDAHLEHGAGFVLILPRSH